MKTISFSMILIFALTACSTEEITGECKRDGDCDSGFRCSADYRCLCIDDNSCTEDEYCNSAGYCPDLCHRYRLIRMYGNRLLLHKCI